MTQDEYNALQAKARDYTRLNDCRRTYLDWASWAETWKQRGILIELYGSERPIFLDCNDAAELAKTAKEYFLRKAAEYEKAMEDL